VYNPGVDVKCLSPTAKVNRQSHTLSHAKPATCPSTVRLEAQHNCRRNHQKSSMLDCHHTVEDQTSGKASKQASQTKQAQGLPSQRPMD
jgi:hypothetical protein